MEPPPLENARRGDLEREQRGVQLLLQRRVLAPARLQVRLQRVRDALERADQVSMKIKSDDRRSMIFMKKKHSSKS